MLNGVTNGIDMDEWNPLTDEFIAANFGPDDLSGGGRCGDTGCFMVPTKRFAAPDSVSVRTRMLLAGGFISLHWFHFLAIGELRAIESSLQAP